MKVDLTYFKLGGKYYSSGTYNTEKTDLEDVWDEVGDMLKAGFLPGLCEDAKEFIVLINAPEHEGNHPRLVMPESVIVCDMACKGGVRGPLT
ncbi:hypothetical protein LCGC14_2382740 [marine sediment metagenome]|uniref:Uncharacterized protein n=1 Tax=marine sediment metagenome TaxID=412755 RepID=A0A0F9C0I4_9ZZZZ